MLREKISAMLFAIKSISIKSWLLIGTCLLFILVLLVQSGVILLQPKPLIAAENVNQNLYLVKNNKQILIKYKTLMALQDGRLGRYGHVLHGKVILEMDNGVVAVELKDIASVAKAKTLRNSFLTSYIFGYMGFLVALQSTETKRTETFSSGGCGGGGVRTITYYNYEPKKAVQPALAALAGGLGLSYLYNKKYLIDENHWQLVIK